MIRSLTHLAVAFGITGSLLGGCVVRAHGGVVVDQPAAVVEVDEEPPAPRVVVAPAPRSGFLWVDGRWFRAGGRWEWREGYWERERANQQWEGGRWERRGNKHVWIEGHWVNRGGPVVRDHRH